MSFFHVIILSIIEGITEFLPISSTGHLVLAAELLNIESSGFLETFIIAIQVGAIAAVVILYANRLFHERVIYKNIALATLPTILAGIIIYPFLGVLLSSPLIPIIALGAGGVLIIIIEHILARHPRWSTSLERVSSKHAVLIGVFQILAFIPGVSRSAATIMGGLLLGISRKVVVEFSFILAIPIMIAATGYDLVQSSLFFTVREWMLLTVGVIVSGIVAYAVIRWLIIFIQKYSFTFFGVYRILLAVVMVGIMCF